jgi:hypothetical protein
MIVAMTSMGMVQMTVDKIVDMVAVRNGLVSATWSVNVPALVAAASMTGGACVRIDRRDFERMLFDRTVGIHVVQVAIVQVVDVVFVLHCGMPAVGTVLVVVVFVDVSHQIVPEGQKVLVQSQHVARKSS